MNTVLPSSQRSLEEVVQSAYISHALDIPLYDALRCGDRWFQSDVAFELADGRVLIYEHDPVYWHDNDRIEKDCEKTQKLLQYDNTLVVRARIGATELPMAHPRLVQLVVPEKVKPASLLYDIARVVCDRLPEPHRSTFRTMDKMKLKDVETYATEVFRDIHPDYDVKLRERQEFLDQYGLQKFDASTFVRIPLSTLTATLETMKAIGIPAKTIASNPWLLTSSSDTLREKGIILMKEFGIPAKAFASNPRLLASSSDTLRANGIILMKEFGIPAKAFASNPWLLTSSPETLRAKASWLRENEFDWQRDPSFLACNLSRMQASLAFLVGEDVPRKLIKKHHVKRLTEVQKRRKYTHASYSTLDGASRLRVLFRRRVSE